MSLEKWGVSVGKSDLCITLKTEITKARGSLAIKRVMYLVL